MVGLKFLFIALSLFFIQESHSQGTNRLLRDLLLHSLDYRQPLEIPSPATYENKKGFVLFIVRASCPIAQLYSPRYQELIDQYGTDFRFFVIFPSPDESAAEIARSPLGTLKGATIIRDSLSLIAEEAEVKTSPTILLLNADFAPVYQGPIDDQYGIEGRKPTPSKNFLADKLTQLQAGTVLEMETQKVRGCAMPLYHYTVTAKAPSPITYYKDIVPILHRGQCLRCHTEGNVAGVIPLRSYDDVAGSSLTAATRIASRRMPPWQADSRYGDFHDARTLSPEDIQTFLSWVEAGSPEGTASSQQADPIEESLSLPNADRTWKMPTPFNIPSHGVLPYQYFLIDSGITEDTWVSAVDVRPGNPAVVHHMRVFVLPPGLQAKEISWFRRIAATRLNITGEHLKWATLLWGLSGEDPSATVLGSYTPGRPRAFPRDTGVLITKGSQLLFEAHYTTNGHPFQTDQSSVSVTFSESPPKHQVLELSMGLKFSIQIPPNDPNFTATKEYEFPRKAMITAFRPHMHLRGRSYRIEMIRPGQEKAETLLWIPYWDYKWQTYYEFKTPLEVEKGTRLIATATWDNSANNPSNPDPTQKVVFGPAISHEMAMAYMNLVWAD